MTQSCQTDIAHDTLSLCVVLTCFNRREKTLTCFRALAANRLPNNLVLSAVVLDDGSTDGTAQALQDEFPWVQIVRGQGDLYWARGMHEAFHVAMQNQHDHYLWLNDDTLLQPDAIVRLLNTQAELTQKLHQPVIVVGSTTDECSGALTYGGEIRLSALKRMRFSLISPDTEAQKCESMNGNVVLISAQAARLVGNVDAAFEHAMGDTDYALRANLLRVSTWVAPGTHGSCSDNTKTGTYMDPSLPLARRWQLMLGRKGLPWRSWLVLTKRHAGPVWPIYFAWPYVNLIVSHLTQSNPSTKVKRP